jgi:hypothetical protein
MIPSEFPTFHDILLHFQTQHFRQVRRASLSEWQLGHQKLIQGYYQQPTLRDDLFSPIFFSICSLSLVSISSSFSTILSITSYLSSGICT